MNDEFDSDDMGKEDRQRQVLQFMAEYPLAMPPTLIYRNLKLHKNITFSDQSVENYLDEFVERGWVDRVEKSPLDAGNLIEADDDSRAYYIITEEGLDAVEEGEI